MEEYESESSEEYESEVSESEETKKRVRSESEESEALSSESEEENKMVEDEDYDEGDDPIVVPKQVRRSTRVKTDLRAAFTILRDGDVVGFLGCWIIRKLLEPAFTLLEGNFDAARDIAHEIWYLAWDGNLKEQKIREEGRYDFCVACNRSNHKVTHNLYDKTDDSHIGSVGVHCWSLKIKPLIDLAKECRELARESDREDFEDYFRDVTAPFLQRIKEWGEKMTQAYT